MEMRNVPFLRPTTSNCAAFSPSPPELNRRTGFPPSSSAMSGARLRASKEIFSAVRSEEHTSELQSLAYLVCRLLLEKKKKIINKLDKLQQAPDRHNSA